LTPLDIKVQTDVRNEFHKRMPEGAGAETDLGGQVRATIVMPALTKISALFVWVVVVAAATADPQYQIYDIGVVQTATPRRRVLVYRLSGSPSAARFGAAEARPSPGLLAAASSACRTYPAAASAFPTALTTAAWLWVPAQLRRSARPGCRSFGRTAWFRSFPFLPAKRWATRTT
jgi:hypothetical protein